jgi:hypothetical protein
MRFRTSRNTEDEESNDDDSYNSTSKYCPDKIRELKFIRSWNMRLTNFLCVILLSIQILRTGGGL